MTVSLDVAPAMLERGQPEHRLRGREVELAGIAAHLDRLAAGAGTVAVIEGEAGMGKSRILAEVVAIARERSMSAGRGAGDPGDAIVQMAPLLEALLQGPSPILERDALRDALTSPEQRYWVLQDLESLLESAALAAPVVICLDDLQWADSSTAAAIRLLPARLATVPVGWFLALRPGPSTVDVRAAVDHLVQAGADKVVLGPLRGNAVREVTADVLLGQPADALLDLAECAGGNPFVLVELLAGLRDEELVRVEDGKVELVEPRVPDRVGDSMRRRLDRASDDARRVATVAASLGRRFALSDVAAMLDLAPAALVAPVDELIHDGILADHDGDLTFNHDLTREGVRSSVPVAVRRGLDRQAAAVLVDSGALPVEVATQLAASAESGDEFAIATLLKAADALAATDPGAAAELGRCALELAPPKHPLRGPLVAGTAVWLHAAARPEEAKAFADTALRAVLPPIQEAEVRLSIASMFSISPDLRADMCRASLRLPGLPSPLRARHMAILLHNLVVAGRGADARALQREARMAVDESGDQGARFMLDVAQVLVEYSEGNFALALTLVESAQRTRLDGDDARVHIARQARLDILAVLDRVDEALQSATESVAAAQRHRQAWALRVFETGQARFLLQVGRLTDAAAILRERCLVDTAHEVVNILDAAGLSTLGRAAIHLGDEQWSRQTAQIARVMVERGAPYVRRHGAWLLALQAMTKDNAVAAHGWLCTHGHDERLSILPLFPMQIGDEARLVTIALGADDRELADAACQDAQRRARNNPEIVSLQAAAAHAAGLFHHDVGHLEQAVGLLEDGQSPLTLAAALEDLGILALDHGDTTTAVDVFSRAMTLFASVEAAWDVARLRGRLRALGVRRKLVVVQRPKAGWGALTDSEAAVARLVAEGLTNREVAAHLFVSPHTVSGHLRSVFTKLAVNSRVDLARMSVGQVGLIGQGGLVHRPFDRRTVDRSNLRR